jgi:hypothetical protein
VDGGPSENRFIVSDLDARKANANPEAKINK